MKADTSVGEHMTGVRAGRPTLSLGLILMGASLLGAGDYLMGLSVVPITLGAITWKAAYDDARDRRSGRP